MTPCQPARQLPNSACRGVGKRRSEAGAVVSMSQSSQPSECRSIAYILPHQRPPLEFEREQNQSKYQHPIAISFIRLWWVMSCMDSALNHALEWGTLLMHDYPGQASMRLPVRFPLVNFSKALILFAKVLSSPLVSNLLRSVLLPRERSDGKLSLMDQLRCAASLRPVRLKTLLEFSSRRHLRVHNTRCARARVYQALGRVHPDQALIHRN
mmetsp:Transcript_30860/g.51066  ORF Transcript_30860/g.51066 Transcript_30860/m.51066 type:complete len:211 (-) Transcript_30860:80-712(-)